jgi:long-chain acyl-CoA synthetase
LTRTRKLRREFLLQRYAALIDGLYAGDERVALTIPITYQDGRRGTMAASVLIHSVDSAPVAAMDAPPQRLTANVS